MHSLKCVPLPQLLLLFVLVVLGSERFSGLTCYLQISVHCIRVTLVTGSLEDRRHMVSLVLVKNLPFPLPDGKDVDLV